VGGAKAAMGAAGGGKVGDVPADGPEGVLEAVHQVAVGGKQGRGGAVQRENKAGVSRCRTGVSHALSDASVQPSQPDTAGAAAHCTWCLQNTLWNRHPSHTHLNSPFLGHDDLLLADSALLWRLWRLLELELELAVRHVPWSITDRLSLLEPAPGALTCVPMLKVALLLLPAGLLKTSMLTVCCSTVRVGELTVSVAWKWEAAWLMLMEVVEVAASPLPAGLPAAARGVRGVWHATTAGDAGRGGTDRRGALRLVGRAPCRLRVARGEHGTAGAGLQGGVTLMGGSVGTCCAHCSRALCASSRPCMDVL
jgi:hypothetical protein